MQNNSGYTLDRNAAQRGKLFALACCATMVMGAGIFLIGAIGDGIGASWAFLAIPLIVCAVMHAVLHRTMMLLPTMKLFQVPVLGGSGVINSHDQDDDTSKAARALPFRAGEFAEQENVLHEEVSFKTSAQYFSESNGQRLEEGLDRPC